jgi:protein required for attachment to host cells
VSAILVVVANGGRARFFGVQPDQSTPPRLKLVERGELGNPDVRRSEGPSGKSRTGTNTNRQAGPVHPIVARRERHEFELDRRFARRIEQRASELTSDWTEGRMVLVAEPQLLGIMREALRAALSPRVELTELAKDYTKLPVRELEEHLALHRLFPVGR